MSDFFRRTAWALALASSLFIAGCDDDDDNGTTPSPITTPTPSPTPSPTPTPTPTATPTPPSTGESVSLLGVVRQVDTGSNTLHVGGTRVHVDGATVIKDLAGNTLTLEQIPNGSTVRVRGTRLSDGGVQAATITLQ
jgi:hypothetical protein